MKHTLLFAFAISTLGAGAQSLTPQVISSTGAFAQKANLSLSYTVGEMSMVETFASGGAILTQGFQQPSDNVTGLIEITKDDFGSLVVYPIPAVDDIWVGFQFPEEGKVSIAITNDLGQKISDVYDGNYDTGKVIKQLNTSRLAAGMYFATVNFTSNKDGKMHITTKKFQIIR